MGANRRELLVIGDLQAAAARLSLDTGELLWEPLAYIARSGGYRAPFGLAVRVARQCCQRFAGEVLRCIREQELRRKLVSGDLSS